MRRLAWAFVFLWFLNFTAGLSVLLLENRYIVVTLVLALMAVIWDTAAILDPTFGETQASRG